MKQNCPTHGELPCKCIVKPEETSPSESALNDVLCGLTKAEDELYTAWSKFTETSSDAVLDDFFDLTRNALAKLRYNVIKKRISEKAT